MPAGLATALLLSPFTARADGEAHKALANRLPEAVREAQKLVEEVRGVPFGGTVASALLPEKALPKLLEEKLVEDLPTTFDKYASSLVAIGLLDPTPDLLKKLVRLYARQVAGFYDPAERKFYVVPERSAERRRRCAGARDRNGQPDGAGAPHARADARAAGPAARPRQAPRVA